MKGSLHLVVIAISAVALTLAAPSSSAQSANSIVPTLVNFSGTLLDVAGKPLTGTVGVTFYLYNQQQGGSPLWMETQNVQPDESGHYSVMLGSMSSEGLPTSLFSSGEARWLGVQAQGQAEQPRVMLLAVPYALKAGDAATIGGLPPSAFVLAPPVTSSTSSTTTGSGLNSTSGTSTSTMNKGKPNVGGSGTQDYIPIWTDSSGDLGNSVLYQTGSGSTARIGLNIKAPLANLDILGTELVRGLFETATVGIANATQGFNSHPIDQEASSFNSGTNKAVMQHFEWQAEPTGNDTNNPGATLNLLFGQNTSTPAETGLLIANTGAIQSMNPASVFGLYGVGSTSGVYGLASNLNGAGVTGVSSESSGTGVTGTGYVGVSGTAGQGGIGVQGEAGAPGTGVLGTTSSGYGVYGSSQTSGWGVYGISGGTAGVQGIWGAPSGLSGVYPDAGVWGDSGTTAPGVMATSVSAPAMVGSSLQNDGVDGVAGLGAGVSGFNDTGSFPSYGVYGDSGQDGYGVYGEADGTGAVSVGVSGISGSAMGAGVSGTDNTSGGIGVYGDSLMGWAGYFDGNVNVTGTLYAGAKAFRIDHPLDPGNKYLDHMAVESSEMLTIYSGNVVLGAEGTAQVNLPAWFEAVNGDFRYQLTAIGAPGPNLYIASEISNGHFDIAGGEAGSKVSWTVTAVRRDPYAQAHPLVVEVEKPAEERGSYLHPELYSARQETGLSWQRYPGLHQTPPKKSRPITSTKGQKAQLASFPSPEAH